MTELVVTTPLLSSPASIFGIEGYHRWDDAITLNKLDEWPRYRVRRISGLHSAGDPEDVRELAVGREGEIVRRSYRRGKTVTYEGAVQARSLAELRSACAALRAAFHDQRAEKVMEVSAHPSYSLDSHFFRARALAVEIDESQGSPKRTSFGWERPMILSVRASDPRNYASAEQTDSVTLATAEDLGVLAATNGGSVASDPVFELAIDTAANAAAPVDFSFDDPLDATRTDNTLTANSNGILGFGITGKRCLLTEQAAAADNGIYVVTSPGTKLSPWVMERASDMDASGDLAQGMTTRVVSSERAGQDWTLATAGPYTLNTTALDFELSASVARSFAIANLTTAKALVLEPVVLDGGLISLDFRTRRVLFNLSDAPWLIDPVSTWWDAGEYGLVPGENEIVVSADPSGAEALGLAVTVRWHDAFA